MTRAQWVAGFWRRVLRLGTHQCWPWTGARINGKYGQLKRENGTNVYAHRASVEIHRKIRVPDHLHVMHTCDNPPCVNPSHLRVGTRAMNMADMANKGRAAVNILLGDDHGSTKVNDADVALIRNLYAMRHVHHTTQAQLAKRFNVTQAQISRILSGKRRKKQPPSQGK